MLLAVAAVIVAYLAGSIPFGVLFARARGVDIQKEGSGNIGATNAARVLGKRVGALVLLCDAAKGALPLLGARWLLPAYLPEGRWTWGVAAVGIAAFVGHLAPPWLRFRGGKGVATGFGVMLALSPLPALVAGAVFVAVYAAWRIASLGSLLAATTFAPALWFFGPRDDAFLAMAAAMWVLIVIKHRGNIGRMLRRSENKV